MAIHPVTFFARHAGFSYDPKTETPAQGRLRCARALAAAEIKARDIGLSFEWQIDPDVTSADWVDSRRDGGKYRDPWQTWVCLAHGPEGDTFASLGGIDFGRNGKPWGSAYRRVIEAELAMEYPV